MSAREESEEAGACEVGCWLRAARSRHWAGPLAGLVASRALLFFFLKPFSFSFLVFKELEKERFYDRNFYGNNFNKTTISESSNYKHFLF